MKISITIRASATSLDVDSTLWSLRLDEEQRAGLILGPPRLPERSDDANLGKARNSPKGEHLESNFGID
jgi:hypothetical protein